MDDLVRWMGEQLDRDRAIAVAAKRQVGDDWGIGDEPYGFIMSDGDTVAYYEEAGSDTAMSRAAAVHAAEHDPARVLREIDAKRKIIERCTAVQGLLLDDFTAERLADDVLALLALPYADRPGYREEWRP